MTETRWVKLVEREADFWKNYMMISSSGDVKRVFGCRIAERLTTRRGMTFIHWLSPRAVWQCSLQIESKLKRGSWFLKKINQVFKRSSHKLVEYSHQLSMLDVGAFSDRQLLSTYNKFCHAYQDLYAPFHLSVYIDSIEDKARRWLTMELKRVGQLSKFEDYWIFLTTSPRPSLLQEEEQSLLAIALLIKRKQLSKAAVERLIAGHTLKYAGLPVVNDETKPWSQQYFARRLGKLLRRPFTQLQFEDQKLVAYSANARTKQGNIFRQFAAAALVQRLFKAIQDSTWIRLVSRNLFALAHYSSSALFAEIGRRRGLTGPDIKWLTPTEVSTLLLKRKLPKPALLRERKRVTALLFRNGQYRIFVGQEAEKFIQKTLGRLDKPIKTKELKGSAAYPGRARGKVKIILSQKDIAKMKRGDILVARMTTPELVPAVRLASAVVTDEGGITCHAAIISRELRIPCIIGTKIATKVLKNGDFVEVDTTHGTVRKLTG